MRMCAYISILRLKGHVNIEFRSFAHHFVSKFLNYDLVFWLLSFTLFRLLTTAPPGGWLHMSVMSHKHAHELSDQISDLRGLANLRQQVSSGWVCYF